MLVYQRVPIRISWSAKPATELFFDTSLHFDYALEMNDAFLCARIHQKEPDTEGPGDQDTEVESNFCIGW